MAFAVKCFKFIAGYGGYIISNIVFILCCLPILLLPSKKLRSRAISHLMRVFLHFICYAYLPALGVYKVAEVRGLKEALAQRSVFVSNHSSLLDSVLLLGIIPMSGIVVKSQYAAWLAIGFLIRVFDFVAVKSPSREDTARVVAKAREIVSEGKNMIVFPEGTRSPSKRVMAFYRLAFKLSMESGERIVPAVIFSNKPVFEKGGKRLIPPAGAEFRIEFLPALYPGDFKHADDLSNAAYRAISKRLAVLHEENEKKLEAQGRCRKM